MISKKITEWLSMTNIIIVFALVAILLLVYLKNGNFELFVDATLPATTLQAPSPTQSSTGTIPLLNNDIIQNSALVNFINRFITNKNQQSVYAATLATRQATINDLSGQVINLINPSV